MSGGAHECGVGDPKTIREGFQIDGSETALESCCWQSMRHEIMGRFARRGLDPVPGCQP